jgi:hypothetical protein
MDQFYHRCKKLATSRIMNDENEIPSSGSAHLNLLGELYDSEHNIYIYIYIHIYIYIYIYMYYS